MEEAKLIVVGAGPGGIASAIEAKAVGIEPVIVLEKADKVCNTIEKFYKPGKRVDAEYKGYKEKPKGLCSFETETKEEFLKRIHSWIDRWNLDIRLKSEVTDIKKKNEKYEVWVKDNPQFLTDFVIIAIGIFGRPNKPSYSIPAEVKDKVFFEPPLEIPEGKNILVVGGGNTAAETAISLCEKNKVSLSYRREKFFRINETNLEILNKKAEEGKIRLLMATDIEEVKPADGGVEVHYKDGTVEVYDLIYYCLGGSTPKRFLQKIGIELKDDGTPVTDEFFETNLPKVFVVGDIAYKQGNIMKAFNSAKTVIDRIVEKYLK
ncbi:MAG: NAD(P)-binding domain-containing protein [Thermodesulfobacteria bacterium]|nr:NAD(P)-binding domain-containing protein [Thermodesulfobacteriota bacterium]